jgi:hypothetical protein
MKNAWLLDHRRDVTSEHGEDGIIEKIFETIGEGSKWCVELGALNGTHDSNVWHLVKERGWNGVLIEADRTYYEKLVSEYRDTPNAHPVNAFVSFEGENSLDALFARTPMPKEFDLLSLDIDGNDYHLWDSLTVYRPRVLVIEFNPSIPDGISFVQPRDMAVYQGSSLAATVALSKEKGYELVCVNAGNAFFVQKDLLPAFRIADNSIESLHTDHSYETQIFQLYDGTLKLAGNTDLIWHRIPIDEEKLQVLPKRKRVYHAQISAHSGIRSLKYYVRTMPWYPLVQRVRKSLHL